MEDDSKLFIFATTHVFFTHMWRLVEGKWLSFVNKVTCLLKLEYLSLSDVLMLMHVLLVDLGDDCILSKSVSGFDNSITNLGLIRIFNEVININIFIFMAMVAKGSELAGIINS